MTCSRFRRTTLSVALAAAVGATTFSLPAAAASPSPLGPDHRVQLLTAPRSADAEVIATDYLAGNLAALGLSSADLTTLKLGHRYTTDGLGTNLFYLQRVDGVPVFNAITSVHVLDSGASHRDVPMITGRTLITGIRDAKHGPTCRLRPVVGRMVEETRLLRIPTCLVRAAGQRRRLALPRPLGPRAPNGAGRRAGTRAPRTVPRVL